MKKNSLQKAIRKSLQRFSLENKNLQQKSEYFKQNEESDGT